MLKESSVADRFNFLFFFFSLCAAAYLMIYFQELQINYSLRLLTEEGSDENITFTILLSRIKIKKNSLFTTDTPTTTFSMFSQHYLLRNQDLHQSLFISPINNRNL